MTRLPIPARKPRNDAEFRLQVMARLNYDQETGAITWRAKHPSGLGRAQIGAVAGTIDPRNGYRVVRLGGVHLRAHRIAWLFITGAWPPLGVDHINGDRDDNRACNLRLADHRQNQQNSRARAGSRSKFKGVWWHKRAGKWIAGIKINGTARHLGLFDCEDDAARAYDAACVAFFGEFARPNFPREVAA